MAVKTSKSPNMHPMRRWAVLLVPVALVAAACGNDDSSTTTEPVAATESTGGTEEPAQAEASDGGELAFGMPATFGDWTATVTSATDATTAGLLGDFSEPAPEGVTYVGVTMDVTYNGSELKAFSPIRLEVLGSQVYEPDIFECALGDVGDIAWELVPGQTAASTWCFPIPNDDIANGLLYVLETVEDPSADPIVFVGTIT